MTASRQFLFLQGLPGDFFRDLADALRLQGAGVHRVNFNGGDLLDGWGRADNYRGHARDWPSFLARLIRARGVTDLVLFGDCRPLHRSARATAAGLGVAVHVFEEGYIRPNWITLEQDGVNGFSSLPTDPAWYLRTAARLDPIVEGPHLPSSLDERARATVGYYLAALALGWWFPSYRTHRPWSPAAEAVGWIARLARRRAAERRSAAVRQALADTRYFVLPLQLDSDSQLRAHSDFDGMGPALAGVIASFARSAPRETMLVVKEHPLDNGLTPWRRQTCAYAKALGVSDRVLFIETGDIDLLVRRAQGLVTVNSTTGTLALAAGVPVITLGRAIYDVEGLTHQGDLESFWNAPQAPDPALYEAYRCVIVHRCLLRGGFYDRPRREALIGQAAMRLMCPPTLAPLAVTAVNDSALRSAPAIRLVAAQPRLRLVSATHAATALP
jgi:capsular polysaccharide export protein